MRAPHALDRWLSTQPVRFRVAFRLRYALFSLPRVGPRIANWWIDR